MREMKFRTWHKKEKFIEELENPYAVLNNEVYNILSGKKLHDIELMCSTGIVDKNGKDIYEGDIVSWKIFQDPFAIKIDEITGVVEWDQGYCMFRIIQLTKGEIIYSDKVRDDIEFYSHDGAEFRWRDLRVIGNKYESSELMMKEV